LSHLEVRTPNRTPCTVAIDSYVCEYIHTWNANSLVIRLVVFQVRMVYRTGKNGLQLFFG